MPTPKQTATPHTTGPSREYLFTDSFQSAVYETTSVHLLPAYDEFLISYKDRSASISLADNKEAVSVNGIFYPVVIVNGQVAGLWRRSVKNNKAAIEVTMFTKPDKIKRELIEKKAAFVGQFFSKETEVKLK